MKVILFDKTLTINAIGFCCQEMSEAYKEGMVRVVPYNPKGNGNASSDVGVFISRYESKPDGGGVRPIKNCFMCGASVSVKSLSDVSRDKQEVLDIQEQRRQIRKRFEDIDEIAKKIIREPLRVGGSGGVEGNSEVSEAED